MTFFLTVYHVCYIHTEKYKILKIENPFWRFFLYKMSIYKSCEYKLNFRFLQTFNTMWMYMFCYEPSVHKKSLQDLCILVNSEDLDEMCGISSGFALFVE